MADNRDADLMWILYRSRAWLQSKGSGYRVLWWSQFRKDVERIAAGQPVLP